MTAGAVAAGGAGTAHASCGITIELHNRSAAASTVDWHASDVRASTAIGGWWRRLGSGSTYVGAGDTERWNFVADFGCSVTRQYRIDVNRGGSSWFVYAPGVGTWTDDTVVHVHVD